MNKLIISPSQAMLLLIEKYRNHAMDDQNPLRELIAMYLDGFKNPSYSERFIKIKEENTDILSQYEISSDSNVINNDQTRRYFETTLSYLTLKEDILAIDYNQLGCYMHELSKLLDKVDGKRYWDCHQVIEGKYIVNDGLDSKKKHLPVNNLSNEYSVYLKRLEKGKIFTFDQGFSSRHREIIKFLIMISYYSVNLAQTNKIRLPLHIYGTGMYSEADRGKIMYPNEMAKTVKNPNYGLMKGHMALRPQDDFIQAHKIIPFLKSSDQATYDSNAAWNKLNFQREVHPFSNSISGTVLCQLRTLAYFKTSQASFFTKSHEEFCSFFRLFNSMILFFSGGHSLFELTYPLSLPLVSSEFKFKNINFKEIDIAHMYSASTVDSALTKAISYNNYHLKHCKLQQEIKKTTSDDQKKPGLLSFFKRNISHNRTEKIFEKMFENMDVGRDDSLKKNLDEIKFFFSNFEYDTALKQLYLLLENTIPETLHQNILDCLNELSLLNQYTNDHSKKLQSLGSLAIPEPIFIFSGRKRERDYRSHNSSFFIPERKRHKHEDTVENVDDLNDSDVSMTSIPPS